MDDLTPELARKPAKPEGDDEAPPRPPTRLRKFLKRALVFGIGLLIIAIVIFFMLPVWMSNEQGRNYLLSRFNKRINGKVEVGSWKLSWFSGTEIQDLKISTADGTAVLTSRNVRTGMTLWSILWGNYDLGDTSVEAPQVAAKKYEDGSTDFSRLVPAVRPAGANPLLTLRGYVTWSGGQVTLSGPATAGKGIVISDFAGQLEIASNSAPTRLTANGLCTGPGASEKVSVVAVLPPLVSWTENPFALLSNMKISAGSLPTAAVSEWVGLSPRWDDSIGATITNLKVSTEPQDGATSLLTMSLRGGKGMMEVRALLTPGADAGGYSLQLALAGENPPPLSAVLRLSQPLRELLSHVNPVLIGMESVDNAITIRSPQLSLDLLKPTTATGRVYVKLPTFTLVASPLMNDILALSKGTGTAAEGPIAIMDINDFNLTIRKERVTTEDIVMMLPSRQRLTFSGSVGFDDTVDLILKTPLPSSPGSASVSTVTLPIGGKVHSPLLVKPVP